MTSTSSSANTTTVLAMTISTTSRSTPWLNNGSDATTPPTLIRPAPGASRRAARWSRRSSDRLHAEVGDEAGRVDERVRRVVGQIPAEHRSAGRDGGVAAHCDVELTA